MLNSRIIPAGFLLNAPYLINDTFNEEILAGFLNNTNVVYTGGLRYVIDTTGKLSMTGGNLVSLAANPSSADPAIWYSSITNRSGRIVKVSITPNSGAAPLRFGFNNIAGTASLSGSFLALGNSGAISGTINGTASPTCGVWTGSNTYQIVVISRSNGCFFFIKGGIYTNWTLLWFTNNGTFSSLYPTLVAINNGAGYTADYIRVPKDLWIPSPLLSDGFSLQYVTDGLGHQEGISNTVGNGGNNQIYVPYQSIVLSSISTPVLGNNLFSNTNFDTDTIWNKGGNWAISGGVASSSNFGSDAQITQPVLTIGKWYKITFDISSVSAGNIKTYHGLITGPQFNSLGSYYNIDRATSTDGGLNSSPTFIGSVDNLQVNEVSVESMLSNSSTYTSNNFNISSDITLSSEKQFAGYGIRVDNIANCQNGIFVYINDTTLKVDKLVSGTWTNLSTNAITYSAGAKLIVKKSGSNYVVIYNQTVIATLSITDSIFNSSVLNTIFSASNLNTFNNYKISDYSSWLYAAGGIKNYPVPGNNVIINGTFDVNSNWSLDAAWSISGGTLNATNSALNVGAAQTSITSIGTWYRTDYSITSFTTGGVLVTYGSIATAPGITNASVGAKAETKKATSTGISILARLSTPATFKVDNITVAPLTLADLLYSVDVNATSVFSSVKISGFQTPYQVGMVTCLDSKTSPQNFILIYLDNNAIKVDKCISGIYTNIASTVFTYSAGAELYYQLRLDSGVLKLRIYYNNTAIGSELSISDASIISNKIHGLFSTNITNTFDDFIIYPTGNSGEYNILDSF